MKNENLVPKVRFKGFSDPWEQRKLKLLADFSKGAGYSKNDIIDQGTPVILYGRLYTNYQVNITTIKDAFVKVRPGSVFSECNDVIVPASGETAEDIARASHVCISGAVLGGDLNIIKPKIDIIDSSFLALCISNGQQNKELVKRAQGKSIVHLHNSDLKQVVLKYPNKTNQSMIAHIFDKTDRLIAANEDKLEQLKTLKKLMMQKIFSQEWRFKGFTDPWEQRKLKWFLRVSKLKNIDGIFDKNSVLSVSGEFGVVNQIAFQGRSFAGKSILNYGILDHNDVVYTKSPLKSNPYGIIKTNLGKAGVVSTLYAVYAPLKTVYSPILGYYFNLDTRVNNYLRPLVNKGAKNDMKVRDEAVLEGKICIPDSIETQKKICNLFSLIDNLIAANEDKLNQLKKLKKYLMQNMFV
ncbi:restriction endonuclease subunit S [Lactiplantibacillus plantarum]|uniref:restriction endonuclease subunit S n=1 Tax=Lactiplantibacillus plantarum TaxID=1590 RepID=UPI000B95BEA9|nr:restriction endonuclease subunit S [Lactiplantibacillus plantarum]MBP5838493.1 restriction endonuclease subunit S [Lactiplantibacillus plantarum]OYL13794.1 restriction endonuclease subunit S [Lactiplantibacillus plantarum]